MGARQVVIRLERPGTDFINDYGVFGKTKVAGQAAETERQILWNTFGKDLGEHALVENPVPAELALHVEGIEADFASGSSFGRDESQGAQGSSGSDQELSDFDFVSSKLSGLTGPKAGSSFFKYVFNGQKSAYSDLSRTMSRSLAGKKKRDSGAGAGGGGGVGGGGTGFGPLARIGDGLGSSSGLGGSSGTSVDDDLNGVITGNLSGGGGGPSGPPSGIGTSNPDPKSNGGGVTPVNSQVPEPATLVIWSVLGLAILPALRSRKSR